VAGSSAVGPVGGAGGNASSLGPMDPSCSGQSCDDAGPGGGGGGGYFGGGGGATGLDKVSGNCGACDGAGSGQPGGAGSSFTSNQTMDPMDMSSITGGTGNGEVVIVPAIEIDAPANGAVYTPGQVVTASWSCGYDTTIGLGVSGCTASVADGGAIDTSPGTHTFTVSGGATSNGNHTVTATITYTVTATHTVTATRVSITAAKIDSTHHTAKFTLKAVGTATRFQCALIERKTNGKYPTPSFSSCRSPKIYKHLKPGKYKFEVRSIPGTSHGSPAIRRFSIT
jgi:hypothetical protein